LSHVSARLSGGFGFRAWQVVFRIAQIISARERPVFGPHLSE
jgi:hypothetical protein